MTEKCQQIFLKEQAAAFTQTGSVRLRAGEETQPVQRR